MASVLCPATAASALAVSCADARCFLPTDLGAGLASAGLAGVGGPPPWLGERASRNAGTSSHAAVGPSLPSMPAAAATAPVAAFIAAATGPRCLFASRLSLRSSRRSALFHRFLIWLSVRPGRSFAISAQRLPKLRCAAMSSPSSSSDHSLLLIAGSRWLCQRSRHCLPLRVGRWEAIVDQERVPN